MRVLNIGSLNIDYVYSVDHIILPGETEATGSRNTFLGGKGMNQSCALAKAGVEVYHGGMIGEDGKMFLDACKEYGVHALPQHYRLRIHLRIKISQCFIHFPGHGRCAVSDECRDDLPCLLESISS